MKITETLEQFGHFHDWYLDIVAVGPNSEPRTLSLGLYRDNERATVTFEGVTCFRLEGMGLLNIVFKIVLPQHGSEDHLIALTALANEERLSDRKASQVAYVYSTLGAELVIEFDSLSIGHETKPTN
ncbi:hypothetical protein SAMN05446635_3920 [Burkholderia sp. OK233]|nr:hypothetical protein SAMN05446635_3920 [Burkholderia sp. OK233]